MDVWFFLLMKQGRAFIFSPSSAGSLRCYVCFSAQQEKSAQEQKPPLLRQLGRSSACLGFFSHTLRHMMRKSSGPSPIKHTSKVRYRNLQRMSRISIFHLIPVVFGDLILLVIHLSSETLSFPRSHAYNRNFTASLLTKGMRAMLGNCPKMLIFFIAIEK